MIKKFTLWLVSKLPDIDKKELAVNLLDEVLSSKDTAIDNTTAERIITNTIKSVGNKVTAFVVKD